MPSLNKTPLTQKQKIVLTTAGALGICLAGGIAWFLFFQKPAVSLPASAGKSRTQTMQAPPVKAAPGQPTLGSRTGAGVNLRKERQEAINERQGEMVRAALNSSSTLGDLARMRGRQHVLAQEVRIAELERRLKEAQQPVVATAIPLQPETIALPPLKPMKKTEAKEDKPKRPSAPKVVSVQGMDGNLSATIRTTDGNLVTVKNGARFGGGILVVTRKRVSVRNGGKMRALSFE